MNAISSASEAADLDQGLHHGALGLPRALERRHGVEFQESRGFDYRFAFFWGGYVAALLGVIAVCL
jgi:hypothetical protein